jgi:mRNA interferase RelE/StbE
LSYKVVIERKAGKDAEKIPIKYRAGIDKAVLSLSVNPRPHNSKKLTEKEGYRVRAGNYRILYTIDDEAMAVVIYRIKTKGKSIYK